MSLSLTKEILSKYPNRYFIETGTYNGGGILVAKECGCFKEYRSVEAYEPYFTACAEKFKGDETVLLWLGASELVLEDMLSDITEPATIFLDSHEVGDAHDLAGVVGVPLLQELKIIAKHPIKNHTILIDDRGMFSSKHVVGGWISPEWLTTTEKKVMNAIYRINKDYQISYEDTVNGKEDLIVAHL